MVTCCQEAGKMDWKECLRKNITKEVKTDKPLVRSLLKGSKNKLQSSQRLKLDDITANSKITLAYDSLRELLEALALKKGYKVYNHECYTAFLQEIINKPDIAPRFDKIRIIRNGINYYGKTVTAESAKPIIKKIETLIQKVKVLINDETEYIEKTRARIKAGNFVTEKEARKRLGM